MKQPYIFIACLGWIMFSCGDAGVQFNVSKELPVSAPFNVPIPADPLDLQNLLDVNPPSQTISYSLSNVTAFSDASQNNQIGAVVFNGMSYEISGIDSLEAGISLDEFSIFIDTIQLTTQAGNLANSGKVALTTQHASSIEAQLLAGNPIDARVVFDLASIPPGIDTLNFDFTLYFDVTIKARL
ncbi:MAG: hypothetical protein OEY56_02970 [Cyclobacteriaceae bacterium]|nr:hypothetical protein [Cyclobacteriaceae bacterium]